jgi:hypothetical protein
MEPQHVIVTAIACNETPRLSRMDGGIARRVDITNFKYKFVDHVLHPEFQRPLDAAVRRNCKANAQWRDALLHMLIKRVPLVLGRRSPPQKPQAVEAQHPSIWRHAPLYWGGAASIPARQLYTCFKLDKPDVNLSETAFGSLATASGLIRRSLKVENVCVGIQRNDAASDTE